MLFPKRKKSKNLNSALRILQKGGIIIFPTDTVWGIGCLLNQPQAIKKLYQIKKREKSKPTAVLVASLAQAEKLAWFNLDARKLAKKFWPGALTIVLKAKKEAPDLILGKNQTIGLRQPNHNFLLKLLKKSKTSIVATSANFSGKEAPLCQEMIDSQLCKKADLILDFNFYGTLASTVVDLSSKPYKIIRQGGIILPSFILKQVSS